MDQFTTPPPIPARMRRNGRRQSIPPPLLNLATNEVAPASPELISSLITSLSHLSAPAQSMDEKPYDLSSLSSKIPQRPSFPKHMVRESHEKVVGHGSFGVDYGAYNRPSENDTPEPGDLDELAAPTPAIKTSRPPSGLSPLTAPKSPRSPGNSGFKSLLSTVSRPTSKGSGQDDASSIGTLSIEPRNSKEHRIQATSDGRSKKQGRNSKGLMYMNSKEALRESERKRSSGTATGLGIDSITIPEFDGTFLAESPIKEESGADTGDSRRLGGRSADTSPAMPGASPAPSHVNRFNRPSSDVGTGRYIPERDSSLRMSSTSQTRSSKRSSRRESRQREMSEHPMPSPSARKDSSQSSNVRKQRSPHPEAQSTLQEPLVSPRVEDATTLASKQILGAAKVEQRVVEEITQETATTTTFWQRQSRFVDADRMGRATSKERKNGSSTPDMFRRQTADLRQSMSPDNAQRTKRDSKTPRRSMASPEPKPQTPFDDRPSSADSIDDSVESYLTSPRLTQKIHHPQTGRTIAFSEVGDAGGHAVFCCVGMGLTRYIMAFYDELALTLKLRLITPDRPGVGESEPYMDGTATPLSWPDDVYAICQALKITKFSILAHSAGAIYALATALRMPQHIRGRIHLLAPWIPPSQLNVFGGKTISPPSNSIPTSQRILRALPTPILKAANSSFMSATSSSLTSSLPRTPRRTKRRSTTTVAGRDTPILERAMQNSSPNDIDKENMGPGLIPKPSTLSLAAASPTHPNHESAILAAAAQNLAEKERQSVYDARLTHAIWDLATTNANPAVDLLVCLERRHTIGFRYVDITRAVVIHHGSKDNRVPVDNVKWLGKTMRRCEIRILEGEGHGLMASAGVMGGVLMEISREWEDWMQVVSNKDGGARKTLRERASVGAFR